MFRNGDEVESFIYSSYVNKYKEIPKGSDKFARKPYLTRQLLDAMDSPDRQQKNIMITGSKGKGSLSIILAKILEKEGLKIGLFTSPHLQNYRERIRINGQAISEADLVTYGNRLKPYYDTVEKGLKSHEYIGPVGATGVMAMTYFLNEKTDFNIVECGRGARYDDINQIVGFMAGINKIFLEHKDALGHSIDEVAYHKAGILKHGMKRAYTAEQSKYADRALRYESRKKEVPLFHYGQDFKALNIRLGAFGTSFDVKTHYALYEGLELSLLGYHQGENAALAIAMAEGVLGRPLDSSILKETLKHIHWPGRMEIVNKKPLTFLDGCITVESLEEVKKVLTAFKGRRVVTILAIPEDKDYLGVLKGVDDFSETIIMTYAENDYLKFSENQVAEGKKIASILFKETVSEAYELGLSLLERDEDILLCLGTQSFIRDMKTLIGQDTLNI